MAEEVLDQKSYQLTIEGDNFSFQREINDQQLINVMSEALGQSTPSQRGGHTPVGASPAKSRHNGAGQVSVGEFLEELSIKNNSERIAGILFYLKEHEGLETVNRAQIPGWFQKAGQPPPKNFPRDLNKAVSTSIISEDLGKAGHYYVTTKGKKLLRKAAPKGRD